MINFKDILKSLMKEKKINQTKLSKILGTVPSVASDMCKHGKKLTYDQAKILNRYFKTAVFTPFKIINDEVEYNYFGLNKTKANEFATGAYIINLFTKCEEKIIEVKYSKTYKEWIYRTDKNPHSWLSEYQIDKTANTSATSKDLEIEEGKKAFLKLIEEQKQKQEAVISIDKVSQKDNIKKVILNIVEQLLSLI